MGFKYTTYKGFMNYCIGICNNKQYEYTEENIKYFTLFENVTKLLDYLVEKNAIEIENNIYYCIIKQFTENPEKTFFNIEYMVNKLIKLNNNETSFYYFCTSLETMLGLKVQFTDEFIKNYNKDNFYYPEQVKAYVILSDTIQEFGITKKDEQQMGKYGVYFIYDENNELAYVGKSLTCAVTRSFKSVKERKLRTFSKIEYRYPKSKSDVAIYEAYYIAKYKPRKNSDMIFNDDLTIELPELPVSYVIEHNKERSYKYEYYYYVERVVDVEEFKNSKNMYLKNEKNKYSLEYNGIHDREKSELYAYNKCSDKMEVKKLTLIY